MGLRKRKPHIGVIGMVLLAGSLVGTLPAAADGTHRVEPTGSYRAAGPTAPVPAIEKGAPAVDPAPWVAPTWGEISSLFEMRWGEMHKGVDIANNLGTPIRAASSGTVIDSGPASGYGLWIRIDHGNGVVSTYGHINESYVQVGQKVESGQPIAALGNRGNSTGPHLHFQIEIGGVPVDPIQFYGNPAALTDWPDHPQNS